MQTTLHQFSELLATLYAGLFIGLLYDVLRMLRRVLRAGKWLTALFDLLFWCAAAFVAFVVLYNVNGGEVRFFSLAGFLSGAMLFIFGISPLIWSLLALIARPFKAIYAYICNILKKFSKPEGESGNDVEC